MNHAPSSASRDPGPRSREGRPRLERARLLCAGSLSNGVVHEFANLLTVFHGLRQMSDVGVATASEWSMLEEPVSRGQALVDAFRYFFSERLDGQSGAPVSLEFESLKILLRARLRGRPTRVEIETASSLILSSTHAAAARLSFLSAVLSCLEHGRGGQYPSVVQFVAVGQGHDCTELTARIHGFVASEAGHPCQGAADELWDAATEVAASVGSSLEALPAAEDEPFCVRVRVTAPRS